MRAICKHGRGESARDRESDYSLDSGEEFGRPCPYGGAGGRRSGPGVRPGEAAGSLETAGGGGDGLAEGKKFLDFLHTNGAKQTTGQKQNNTITGRLEWDRQSDQHAGRARPMKRG